MNEGDGELGDDFDEELEYQLEDEDQDQDWGEVELEDGAGLLEVVQGANELI